MRVLNGFIQRQRCSSAELAIYRMLKDITKYETENRRETCNPKSTRFKNTVGGLCFYAGPRVDSVHDIIITIWVTKGFYPTPKNVSIRATLCPYGASAFERLPSTLNAACFPRKFNSFLRGRDITALQKRPTNRPIGNPIGAVTRVATVSYDAIGMWIQYYSLCKRCSKCQ